MIHVTKLNINDKECDICGDFEKPKYEVTNDPCVDGYILCKECKNQLFPKFKEEE